MDATRETDGTIRLHLSHAEATVLHEVIAFSEWSNELEVIELRSRAERRVVSEVQQALQPCIPGLGTDEYEDVVKAAYSAIDSGPF